jgi:hypothetical protein
VVLVQDHLGGDDDEPAAEQVGAVGLGVVVPPAGAAAERVELGGLDPGAAAELPGGQRGALDEVGLEGAVGAVVVEPLLKPRLLAGGDDLGEGVESVLVGVLGGPGKACGGPGSRGAF